MHAGRLHRPLLLGLHRPTGSATRYIAHIQRIYPPAFATESSSPSTTCLPESDNGFLDTSLDIPLVNRRVELDADGELAQAGNSKGRRQSFDYISAE